MAGKTQELAVIETPLADVNAPMTAGDLVNQVQILQSAMKAVMREGEHFGVIPGTPKPTLLKPGAEKLGLTFRLAPRYVGEREPIQLPDGHREYVISCALYTIGSERFVGMGLGSCSTMESKYRWRSGAGKTTGKPVPKDYWNARKTDSQKAQQILGGPGFVVGKTESGAYEIFEKSDERVENRDLADQFNTVLKMALKRAFVSAIMTATAASDIFTQDMEDVSQEAPARKGQPEPAEAGGDAAKGQQGPAAEQSGDDGLISEKQRIRFFAIAKKNGMDKEKARLHLVQWNYSSSKDIPKRHYEAIVACIEQNRKPTEKEIL